MQVWTTSCFLPIEIQTIYQPIHCSKSGFVRIKDCDCITVIWIMRIKVNILSYKLYETKPFYYFLVFSVDSHLPERKLTNRFIRIASHARPAISWHSTPLNGVGSIRNKVGWQQETNLFSRNIVSDDCASVRPFYWPGTKPYLLSFLLFIWCSTCTIWIRPVLVRTYPNSKNMVKFLARRITKLSNACWTT